MKIDGKVALVTGGAVRVGRAIALGLARAGASVAVNYHRSETEAQATVHELATLGVAAIAVRADIADVAQIRAMVDRVQETLGGLDILVNSASPFVKTAPLTTDPDTWHYVLGVLIDGPFFLSQAAAPLMLARGEGAIVNILDLSIYKPWTGFLAHSVGKAGLLALTRGLAIELAPAIRVNAVVPGPVLAPPDYPEAKQDAQARRTLLRRWGTPADVVAAVTYLIEADYITGETLTVDGGARWAGPGATS